MHKSDTVYENKHHHRHEYVPNTSQTCTANKGGRRAVLSRYNLLSLVLIYRILVANIHTLGTPLPKGLCSVCKL